MATGLLSWQVKTNFSQVLDQYPLLGIAAYTGVFFLLTIVLVIFEEVVTWLWGRWISVRYWIQRLTGDLFVEGSWVDVGIDTTGSRNRLLNFSSINIKWTKTGLFIEGITYDFHSGEDFHWWSEHSDLKEEKLSFWYVGSRYGSAQEHDKAEYLFVDREKGHAVQIEGKYGDAEFKTKGQFLALSSPSDRKVAGQQYLKQFQAIHGYDDFGFQVIRAPDVPHDERHWYRTFLRCSNKIQKETELIQRVIANVPTRRKIESIADIGPADGEITGVVLSELIKNKLLSSDARYTAVEPSGRHLDSIENQIASALPKRNFTFLKHPISDALPFLNGRKFDLVLLANVLYYVRESDEVLKELVRLLSPGGILFSLHDDFAQDEFLLDLLQTAKSTVETTVVSKISGLKNQSKLKIMESETEYVQIVFPEITNKQWEAVESGEAYYRDSAATDAINLISFLVNRDMGALRAEKRWPEVVKKIRKQLQKKGTIELCATAQILQRN